MEQTKAHGLRIAPPKTKSSKRRITLPAAALDMLRTWRRKQSEEHLVLGLGQDQARLVFTRQDGEPYSPRTISTVFTKAVKLMPITQISFHGLRHTHITHLLRDNVHIKVVSARAGHASVSITLDVYGHLIDNMDATAATAIDGWFTAKED